MIEIVNSENGQKDFSEAAKKEAKLFDLLAVKCKALCEALERFIFVCACIAVICYIGYPEETRMVLREIIGGVCNYISSVAEFFLH